MSATDHISQDDLALFALQLLPEVESSAVRKHAQDCAACRKQIAEFHGDLAIYSLSAEMQRPSENVLTRLIERVAAEPRAGSGADQKTAGRVVVMPTREERRAGRRYVPYLGWAAAAAFALASLLQYYEREQWKYQYAVAQRQLATLQQNATSSQEAMSVLGNAGALNVALHSSPANNTASAPQGRAAYLPDRGALVFVATNMEALQPNKVYELWLLPAKAGEAPIPAASFRPDKAGNATVVLPTGPKIVEVVGFGVTQEDSRTAPRAPTLPILMSGTSKT